MWSDGLIILHPSDSGLRAWRKDLISEGSERRVQEFRDPSTAEPRAWKGEALKGSSRLITLVIFSISCCRAGAAPKSFLFPLSFIGLALGKLWVIIVELHEAIGCRLVKILG